MVSSRQVGPADRTVEKAIAREDYLLVVLGKNDMPERMSRAMADLEPQLADLERFTVRRIPVDFRRIFVVHPERCELMRLNTHHQWLTRQGIIAPTFPPRPCSM